MQEIRRVAKQGALIIIKSHGYGQLEKIRLKTCKSRLRRMLVNTVWLRIMIAAAKYDPRVYENHIRPQVDLQPKETEVFRLEDGLEAVIPRLDAVVGDSAPDLTIGHLLKRKAEPISISREDARLIADYYSSDYERFGYLRPNYDTFSKDPAARLRDFMAAPLGRTIVARQRRAWLQT